MRRTPGKLLSLALAAALVGGCSSGDDDGGLTSVAPAPAPSPTQPRNLSVLNLLAPTGATAGSVLQVTGRVEFEGEGADFEDVAWRLVRIENGVRTVLDHGVVARIRSGEVLGIDAVFTVTGSNGDDVILCFEIDPDDEQSESDEDDNDESATVTVIPPTTNG